MKKDSGLACLKDLGTGELLNMEIVNYFSVAVLELLKELEGF